MNIKQLLFMAVAAAAVAACSHDIVPEPAVRQLRVISPGTRVQLNSELRSVWNAGDKASVFYKSPVNECWAYDGEDGASEGVLKFFGDRNETENGIFAIYPYVPGNTLSGSVITTTLPASQEYLPASFGKGAALMASKAAGDALQFHFLTAFIRLEWALEGEIVSLSASSCGDEAVAGPASVEMSGSVPVLSLTGTEKTVSVASADGAAIPYDGKVIFSIAPGTYTKGFRFTATLADGSVKSYTDTRSVTVNAGHIKPYAVDAL